MIMSLRDGARSVPSKQSPVSRGDCFATCARNDMLAKVNTLRGVAVAKSRRIGCFAAVRVG